MTNGEGISFLYEFDLGNRDVLNPGANVISVTGTADGDFDKANLTTESVRQVWRSADCTAWQEVVIKAELKTRIDTLAILGHNFTEDAVVQVQANIDDNWVAPPFNRTVPWTELNMVLCEDFADDYEYYRVRVLDPGNPCGFIEIGRIVGGRAFTFQGGEDITDEIEIEYEDMADAVKTEGFFRVSNVKVTARSLSVKFNKLYSNPPDNANFLGLRSMYRVVGKTKPFLTVVDRGDPAFCSVWGQLEKVPRESYTVLKYMSQSIKIDEVF